MRTGAVAASNQRGLIPGNVMKGVWAVLLVLLAGCSTARESYSILNLDTGEKASVKKVSPFRDIIIGQDAGGKTIRIFTRTKDYQFEIREVRYDGSVARVIRVPCFAAPYLQTYACDMFGLAVSKDASRIAYYDQTAKDLRLFNVIERSHEVLLTNAAPSLLSVQLLQWRCENELVACIYEWGMPTARCFMLNAANKALGFDCHPVDVIFSSLSPDGRYLVLFESLRKGSREHQYRLYDLTSRGEIGTIRSPDGVLGGGPALWAGASDGIFYARRNQLMLYSLASNESKCLREYAPGMDIYPKASAGRKVFYSVKPKGAISPTRGLYIYDLDQQRELHLDKVQNNAVVIASPDGKHLITGWGL
jgi:WD40 repeat protein